MTLTQTDVVGLLRPADNSIDAYPANSNTSWYYAGTNESVETFEVANNVQRVEVLGDRNAESVIEQQFEGSFSYSFDLTHDPSVAGDDVSANGWEFLEGIVSPIAGDSDEATADSEDTFVLGDSANWFDMVIDQPSSTSIVIATGCVATSVSFEVNVEETVTVSIDGFFADTDTATDIDNTNIEPRVSADPYTFDEARVTHDDASLYCPQGFTLDVENNVSPTRCLGNRVTQHISEGNVNPSVTITDLVDKSSPVSLLDRALGGSNVSSANTNDQTASTITFTLSKGGTDEVEFVMDGALADTMSYSGISADAEEVEAEINEVAVGCTIDTNIS